MARGLGALWQAARPSVDDLIRAGYPEGTARKIASGELPMDEASRMARAGEQGFDTSRTLYHGTPFEDITEFRLGPHDETSINSLSLTDDPRYAGDYAMGGYGRHLVDGGYLDESGRFKDWVGEGISPSIMPVHVKGRTPDFMDATDEFRDANKGADWDEDSLPAFLSSRGSHGVEMFGDEVAMLDPAAIRSKYAAFDPDNVGKPNLLGSLALPAAGALGAGLLASPQEAEAGPVDRFGRRMIEAWHGSPHKFDKFSMDKIGTGEGAQAYGHGLYFADSKDVAKGYRDDLTATLSKQHTLDGEDIPAWIVEEADAGRTGKVRVDFEDRIAEANAKLANPDTIQPWIIEGQKATAEKVLRQLDALESGATATPPGALYRTQLDVDPDSLLDYDLPLSEQSEAVQDAVKATYTKRSLDEMTDDEFYSVMQNMDSNGVYSRDDQIAEFGSVSTKDEILADMAEYNPDGLSELQDYLSGDIDLSMTGGSLYKQGTAQRGGGGVYSNEAQAALSEELKKQGIPGLRYKDAMSRGSEGGSSNYVMFDDKPISITERGAIDPKLLGALGAGSGALAGGMFMSPDEAQASMMEEGLSGGLDTALGIAADTGQFAYGGGNALGSALMGRDATDAFTEATQDPIYQPSSRTSEAVTNLLGATTGALMDYQPFLRDQTVGEDISDIGGWLSDTARPWLQENLGEYGTNLLEGAGLAGAAVLGGKGKKAAPDGYDERFLYGTNAGKQRLGEADRANNLEVGIEDTAVERPRAALEDYIDKPFITSMSDRTSAAGRLTDVNGRPLSQPVDLQGGKDYMFNNPGQVWASAPTVVSKLMGEARKVADQTGQSPLFLPWRMAPSGGDFSHMTSDTLLNYARDNMSAAGRNKANKEIRSFFPEWRGLEDIESNSQINDLTGPVRSRVRKAVDKQRNEGGLSITEARLATTDPDQLNAPEGYTSHVGLVDVDGDIIPESGHNTYDAGLPGQGLGVLDDDVPIWQLLGEERERLAQQGRIINPFEMAAPDRRKLEMKPYSGILREEDLYELGLLNQ